MLQLEPFRVACPLYFLHGLGISGNLICHILDNSVYFVLHALVNSVYFLLVRGPRGAGLGARSAWAMGRSPWCMHHDIPGAMTYGPWPPWCVARGLGRGNSLPKQTCFCEKLRVRLSFVGESVPTLTISAACAQQ